jgi:iron complex outermembrane recepter protein
MATPAAVCEHAARTRAVAVTLGLISAALGGGAGADPPKERIEFNIPRGNLADALDRFGEQSGLQIVYDYAIIERKRAPAVVGWLPAGEALERCLAETGLAWDWVNDDTIVLKRPAATRAPGAPGPALGPARVSGTSQLGDLHVIDDSQRMLPLEPSAAAFGFDKPLLATPRSVSVISVETIELFGLSAVEDLVRVVPGAYTTTRWGIQGSIDIRNVPADTYFRGMKRLNLQGHGRSVLAAMETIEIVKGPPSPIYGMGKIGGYTNMEPKSVRAATGGYLLEPQGFVQTTVGAYDKSEMSFGVGGPLRFSEKRAGYYVYGLVEDSDSFTDHVPIDQSVLQAAVTVDDFIGPLRLETGVNLQRSETAGALLGRFTQDVADSGRYIRGTPLVDLDANGNGRIGYLEMYGGSPVRGEITSGNQALRQYWAWPTDAAGNPLTLDQFPPVSGIPQSMHDYLTAHPEADPTGLLRAQGPGGPAPISGYVPAGFSLDPRTVRFDTLDLHRPGAFERELEADYAIVYFDLIYDENANFTIKNQLFLDSMNQYKLSEQPFSQTQEVYVIENKLTATHRLRRSPGLDVDFLASANVRYTSSDGYTLYGDYSSHRVDAMSGDGMPGPNTVFATSLLNEDLADDGAPWSNHYDTDAWELGVATLFDIVIDQKTNLVVGARVDRSHARNVDFAGTLDLRSGTAWEPAVFLPADARASGRDTSVSWSFSVSRELAENVRPYLTLARTGLALDGNNNRYDNDVIEAGHLGEARLVEIGVKADLLDGELFMSAAAYDQARTGVSEGDDRALFNAHVSSTATRGSELELKWAPTPKLFLSFYALEQTTTFRPNLGGAVMVDGRALGFQDVVDTNGEIVYPAEAFLYGGRSFIVLPPNVDAYEEKQGNPETQIGMSAQYELGAGFGVTLNANYFSSVYAGRLRLVELPEARVFNAGVYWTRHNVQMKYDVLNVLDERYFRARTGDTLADVLVSPMPGRQWQFTVRMRF